MGKMKDSSLLKWTQNNKNNLMSGNKESRKKSKEDKNKNWLHSPERLTSGHIAYLVKFLGSTEVEQPKGIDVVKEGIRKLKFSQQIKKAEGTKTPKVELTVSIDGVAIQEPKTKKIQHQYPLHRISYCADDKAEKRFFSFIAKEEDSDKHTCFVFVSDKLAEEITLTIGQAFDLAYKRFLSGKTQESDKEKIAGLERENAELAQRLKDVSNLVESSKLSEYMKKNNIKELVVVGEREILDNVDTPSQDNNKHNVGDNGLDVSEQSEDSAVDTQDKLINFDDPVNKLDHMTLDDLNDDDFDPRANNSDHTSDSSESDDFNPRSGSGGFSAFSVSSPPSSNITPPSNTPQTCPAKILPPPSIPSRDPAKINGSKIPAAGGNVAPAAAPVMGNPFTSANDAFGMSSFSANKDPFAAGGFGQQQSQNQDFSLGQLDPFKN